MDVWAKKSNCPSIDGGPTCASRRENTTIRAKASYRLAIGVKQLGDFVGPDPKEAEAGKDDGNP